MCEKHQFRKIKKDSIIRKGECIPIEILQCVKCKKVQIIDIENCKIISARGRFGKEI